VTETARADDSKTVVPATSADAKPAVRARSRKRSSAVPAVPVVEAIPAVAAVPDVAPEPTHHHPNLGLAPADMLAGFPAAAEEMRRDQVLIAARAMEVAMDCDATIAKRYNDSARRSLLHDAELLTERLAMCISSNDPRWLAEYAEWIGPIYRRRGVPLADLATICEGIRVATTRLGPAEADARDHSLDAAVAVFRKNGRLAGDRHKRNALLRWLYRGV
jgi:hypothetical protein